MHAPRGRHIANNNVYALPGEGVGEGGARHYYLRCVPWGWGTLKIIMCMFPGEGMHLVRQNENNNVYVSPPGGDIDIIIFNLFALGHIQDDNACPQEETH